MPDARQGLHDLGRRLLAEHYPHLPADRLKIIQGEPVHTVWRAATHIGDVCLKRTSVVPEILEFTTAAHEHLFRNRGRVPELIPTSRGARFFLHEGHAIALYGWVNGSPLVMDEVRPHLRLAVDALAQFHAASQGFNPPGGVTSVSILGKLPERLEEGLAALRRLPSHPTTEPMLRQGEEALKRLRASGYGPWVADVAQNGGLLAHRRYRKGNALVVDDGVAILDLEHLAYSLPVEDLRAVILDWMETQGGWNRDDLEEILTCYSDHFTLSRAQRGVVCADLLFPHRYLKAAQVALHPVEDEEPPDLEAIAALEEEKRHVLAQIS